MRAAIPILLAAGCGFRGQAVSDGGPRDIDAALPIDGANPPPTDSTFDGPASVHDAPAMVDASALTCPTSTGWIQLGNGGHYYFSPSGQTKPWWPAEDDCEMRGNGFSRTHLAVIGSTSEATTVGAQLGATGVSYAWIGTFQANLSLGKTLNWLVVTGGAAFTNWATGEPSDGGNLTELGAENFAQLYPPGTMNDTRQTDNLRYICECDGVAVDQATLDMAQQDTSNNFR